MPKFIIHGARKSDGQPLAKPAIISAPTEDDAINLMSARGVMVTDCRIALDAQPDAPDVPLEHRKPNTRQKHGFLSHNPNYPLLRLSGLICSGMGLALIIIAVVTVAVVLFLASTSSHTDDFSATAWATIIATTIGHGVTGIFLGGAGQIMLAVRDIALNSFRMVEKSAKATYTENNPNASPRKPKFPRGARMHEVKRYPTD